VEFYINKEKCVFCDMLTVTFVVCSDGVTVVCLCDECGAVWIDPRNITEEGMQLPEGDYHIINPSGLSVSVLRGSRYATCEEIKAAGYLVFSKGPYNTVN